MAAFDYDKQEWIEGEAARVVRVNQLRDELKVLTSGRGEEYLIMTGGTFSLQEAIAGVHMELRLLNGGVL